MNGGGAPDREDLAAVAETLDDEDPVRRAAALRTLGKGGAAASFALPRVLLRLQDPDPIVRAMAASALGRLGPKVAAEAVEPLVGLLGDPVGPVRFWALDALSRLADVARGALDRVEDLVGDEHEAVRGAARRAVAAIRAARAGREDSG